MKCLGAYKFLAEKGFGGGMYAVELDSAGEQTHLQIREFVSGHDMSAEFSPACAIFSNGLPECLLQHIWKTARRMLIESKLSKKPWPGAISHSNCLWNQLSSRIINMDILFTRWYNTSRRLPEVVVFVTRGNIFQYRRNIVGGGELQ